MVEPYDRTGTGMDEDTLGQAFEPFFTTRGVGLGLGLGLGLSTVDGIVSQSGGRIEARSRPAAWTTIKIHLPASAPASRLEPEHPPPQRSEAAAATVLLCEDEPAVRDVLTRVLSAGGYRVLSASAPGEALALAEGLGGELDALVTDVIMPGMSGPALAERLRSRLPHLRVMFVSGSSAGGDAGSIIPSGSAYLHKPFSPAQLLDSVRALLESAPD